MVSDFSGGGGGVLSAQDRVLELQNFPANTSFFSVFVFTSIIVPVSSVAVIQIVMSEQKVFCIFFFTEIQVILLV